MIYAIKVKASHIDPTNEEANWPLTLILLYDLDDPFIAVKYSGIGQIHVGNGLTCGLRIFNKQYDATTYAKAYIRHNVDYTFSTPHMSCFKLQGGFTIHKVEKKGSYYNGKEE